MARHSRSGLEYAIKFFIVASTFHDESAIYQDRNSGLGQFADRLKLPRVRSPSIRNLCLASLPVQRWRCCCRHSALLCEVCRSVLRCATIVASAAGDTHRRQQEGRAGVPVGVRAAAVHRDGEGGVTGQVVGACEA